MSCLLLLSSDQGNNKITPNIFAFKPCIAYMGSLKTMFTNKFCEWKFMVFFHKVHQSKILASVCDIKMEYSRNNNIRLIDTNKITGKFLTAWTGTGVSISWKYIAWSPGCWVLSQCTGAGFQWQKKHRAIMDPLQGISCCNPGITPAPHNLQHGSGIRHPTLVNGGGANGSELGGIWRQCRTLWRIYTQKKD